MHTQNCTGGYNAVMAIPTPKTLLERCPANHARAFARWVTELHESQLMEDLGDVVTEGDAKGRGSHRTPLRRNGLRINQLHILAVLADGNPVNRIDIGKKLYLDRSTLTKNLKGMIEQGWLKPCPRQGRTHPVMISEEGMKLLERARGSWAKAQEKAREQSSEAFVAHLREETQKVIQPKAAG